MATTSKTNAPFSKRERHYRITQLCETFEKLKIHYLVHDWNNLTVGVFPTIVDVFIDDLSIPEQAVRLELYRCHVWNSKEQFSIVALGPGYLLSQLVLRNIKLHILEP